MIMIAFMGSVFSPFYARAISANKRSDPLDYCAFNVGFYGPHGRTHWVFTEFPRGDIGRSATQFDLAGNQLCWDDHVLRIQIDDRCAPRRRRIRGRIDVHFTEANLQCFPIDDAGQHQWCPIAPFATAEVSMHAPDLDWSGHAYIDSNQGEVPLHHTFDRWNWSRTHTGNAAQLTYNTQETDGRKHQLALAYRDGEIQTIVPQAQATLPTTGWSLERHCQLAAPTLKQTLDDTPFYARSLVESDGGIGMHESLSLERFRKSWVQRLLPFRMRFPTSRLWSTP